MAQAEKPHVEPATMSFDIQTSAVASSVFEPGDPIIISPTIRNPTNQARNVDFEYQLSDSHGQVLSNGTVPGQVPAGGQTTLNIPFDETSLPQQEYLELQTRLLSGGVEFDSDTMGLGILPNRAPAGPSEDSQFGLLIGWHDPEYGPGWKRYYLAQRAGARWSRPGIDPTDDRYVTAEQYGVEPILLFLTDPSVGSIGPESVINGTVSEAEFAAYVTRTVTDHKGLIKYYQIGNEPNPRGEGRPEKIVAALKVAYEAAKAADPDSVIVAPGICAIEVKPEAWTDLLRAGIGRYCDVYDHHFYCTVTDMDRFLTFINQENERFNAIKPQFVTETSVGYTNPPWTTSEAVKSAHLIKRYIIAISKKIQVPFWFCLWWPEGYGADGPDAAATEASLLDPATGYPLISYFTFAAMTRELEGAEFTQRLDLGNGIFAMEFDHGTYTNLILWSDVGDQVVSLEAVNGPVGITEISGRKTFGQTVNGQFTITAGNIPVILSFAPEPVPVDLVGIRLTDPHPENNTDRYSQTNEAEVLVILNGSSGPGQATVHLAADQRFHTGHITKTWTPQSNSFQYHLSGRDGVKTVYARLETKPGEFSPVVSTTITLDTASPCIELVEINGGEPETTTAHIGVNIAVSNSDGKLKTRIRENGSTWSGWKDFLAYFPYRLSKGDGIHTLEVQVCDNAGNLSDVVSEGITLTLAPSLREHRNLYNIDFGSYFWKPDQVQPEGGPFRAESIHRFVRLLADSGTDTFVINPNSKIPWYPSKVVPTILTDYVRDDPAGMTAGGYGPEMLNLLLDLQESNVDWLAESIRACRQNGISPWVSVRMNDPHGQAPYMESALHKDAKYRLGEQRESAKLNYKYQKVRDYYFTIIRELIEDYDFEGLELDWKRSAVCIPPPASQEQVDMMTAWFTEIRKLTQAKAIKTGRPFYFGMHVPSEYKKLRNIGIDIEAMVEAGLIDFLCPTNFMQTAWDIPYDQIKKELGSELTLYGVTELWIKADGRSVCDNPPALRGNAAGKLVLGADGIEQYNFFWAQDYAKSHPAMQDLHDLESLRGQTKHYVLSRVGDMRYMDTVFDRVVNLPAVLGPGRRRMFRMPMCAEPTDQELELAIQVVVKKTNSPTKVGVSFNGGRPNYDGAATDLLLFPSDPRQHGSGHQATNYRFSVDKLIEGWNEIVLTNSGEESIRIVGLELGVQKQTAADTCDR